MNQGLIFNKNVCLCHVSKIVDRQNIADRTSAITENENKETKKLFIITVIFT